MSYSDVELGRYLLHPTNSSLEYSGAPAITRKKLRLRLKPSPKSLMILLSPGGRVWNPPLREMLGKHLSAQGAEVSAQ